MAQRKADCLPANTLSTENGSMLFNTSQWPLIVDPQLQGVRWIKKKDYNPEISLEVVRLRRRGSIKKLECALENGHRLLIENIGESLKIQKRF